MKSMTGFGHGEYRDERVQMVLEMRSYNNRFLELFVNLPYGLKQLEPRVREVLSSRIQRGKVELYLGLTELEDSGEIVVDHARARGSIEALKELRRLAGLRSALQLSDLLGMEGVLKTLNRSDPEAQWALLAPLMDRVFADFDRARQTEGTKTEADLRRLAEEIAQHLGRIEQKIPEIEQKIKGNLRDRFRDLLGDGVDESRILAETAVQLMRFDINEEIQRMKAHLESMLEGIAADGPQGKRLDFICQELGREINTIGSKSVALEVDRAVIAVKDLLEKVREQLRNVE